MFLYHGLCLFPTNSRIMIHPTWSPWVWKIPARRLFKKDQVRHDLQDRDYHYSDAAQLSYVTPERTAPVVLDLKFGISISNCMIRRG